MAALSVLIRGGRVVDPGSGIDEELDIFVENGKIAAREKDLSSFAPKASEVIQAKGKVVTPGLIDMHVHLRDPGRGDEETIASGTRAAALGGFTSVACMANTEPPIDTPAVVEYILSKVKSEGAVNVFPVAAVTKGLLGKELSEMGRLFGEGAVAFSDDGHPIMDAEVMRRALEYARQLNLPIISHCEDLNLSEGGVLNESYTSTVLGLRGIPALAEELMVARDLKLAEGFGKIHIAHVSTAGSVELIRKAKEKKVPVTSETAPHYFTLTEGAVEGYNTSAKVNPPLRTEKDVAAIVEGLKDGTLDAIASDHAPHRPEEKRVEFALAAFGMVGLETTLALVLTELVETGVLSLPQAIEKLTVNPAKILNLKKGGLRVGEDADLTIIDLEKEVKVDINKFASKSKNSPFHGWKLKGQAWLTMVGGKIVVRDGKLTL